MRFRSAPVPLALALVALSGCHVLGGLPGSTDLGPPAIGRIEITSDVRLDSAGGLRGSMVGEGTSRAVHLVSSDTGLIAMLVRRFRPDIIRDGDLWTSLSRAGSVTIDPSHIDQGAGRYLPRVASPEGHTDVRLSGVLARGGTCGWRGAQAELIVEAPPVSAEVPGLRGPVVGSFRLASEVTERQVRRRLAPPSAELITSLLDHTVRSLDSALDLQLNTSERPLTPVSMEMIPVNSLLDVDAADIVPIQTLQGIRYVVSLRRREVTATGDTVVAATVMMWDAQGGARQTIMAPTLLNLTRGRILPRRGSWVPVYWRRLQSLSGFEYPRDYIWMEQVAPMDGSVIWSIIDPTGNVVVAAAEMQGPCTQ
ncbi:MAG: hypothetical protein ABI679_09200 [Gemmatimonadota bacterium]